MEYLYHYTSLDTLALILAHKTICFNNLTNVDDIEEAETEDMGDFGKFCYVSCWTEDNEESIPLWNLYTPNMRGVRIKLPKFPFEKYHYKKGNFLLNDNVDTYINLEKYYVDNKVSITANQPQLVKIQYTDDRKYLYPHIKKESVNNAAEKFINADDLSSIGSIRLNYDLSRIGRYKSNNWSFQKEWRYIISVLPIGVQDLNHFSLPQQQDLIRRLEDKTTQPPFQKIFLNINEECLKEIEILMGPKMSEADIILCKSLINKYCPSCICKESSLKIRK